ncbi:thioredoxin-like protein [Cladochytrium replicatum]|nr:thioredoxin-like protein [Cladochytrium replicatum]
MCQIANCFPVLTLTLLALAVGDTVPDFPLINEENQDVKLHDLVKEKGAVIFVYPAANTGGCTKQACDYRDHFTDFEKAGYQVFGMSKDKPTPQSNWKKKHNFQYHLLSDPHFSVQTAFGVASGKKVSRSHIVIEKGGKILDISKGVKPGDSAGQALETIGGKKW